MTATQTLYLAGQGGTYIGPNVDGEEYVVDEVRRAVAASSAEIEAMCRVSDRSMNDRLQELPRRYSTVELIFRSVTIVREGDRMPSPKDGTWKETFTAVVSVYRFKPIVADVAAAA